MSEFPGYSPLNPEAARKAVAELQRNSAVIEREAARLHSAIGIHMLQVQNCLESLDAGLAQVQQVVFLPRPTTEAEAASLTVQVPHNQFNAVEALVTRLQAQNPGRSIDDCINLIFMAGIESHEPI